MNSPYSSLPDRAFWRSGVAECDPSDPGEVFVPRFPITRDHKIMTAGSCFAQHVGRNLRDAKFNVLDVEPTPARVDPGLASRFGYGMYTARYGNIYTTRQLIQLFREAHGEIKPANPVWERDGRFFDAQRPNTEPDGLDSPETVMRLREEHLAKVREAFHSCDVFVFTFGLTEAWLHNESGTVYPTAPGTIAGDFDPELYSFHNLRHQEVLEDFLEFRARMREIRPGIKFLITTSPVPLTATASGQHVEVATIYSKSVLRAVCGELYQTCDDVDYFPSYEIITSQRAGGSYYEANLRSVAPHGVAMAMSKFMTGHGVDVKPPATKVGKDARASTSVAADGDFAALVSSLDRKSLRELLLTARNALKDSRKPGRTGGDKKGRKGRKSKAGAANEDLQSADDDVVCEDELLEAFNR